MLGDSPGTADVERTLGESGSLADGTSARLVAALAGCRIRYWNSERGRAPVIDSESVTFRADPVSQTGCAKWHRRESCCEVSLDLATNLPLPPDRCQHAMPGLGERWASAVPILTGGAEGLRGMAILEQCNKLKCTGRFDLAPVSRALGDYWSKNTSWQQPRFSPSPFRLAATSGDRL